MKFSKLALTAMLIFVIAGAALAQDRKPLPPDEQTQYVVSAKIGVINFVEGDVSYKRDKSNWEMLIEGDELRTGDAVKTGANGRVEILLNPGSYLRLNENTGFFFSDASLMRMKLSINYGSAILETSVIDGLLFVATPESRVQIVRGGLYRFNAGTDGRSEVFVRRGRLAVKDVEVKEGKKAVLDGSVQAVASVDKKLLDGFDTWSKDRAKKLVAINNKLSKNRLRFSLASSVGNVWLYDPFFRCYTFLPFDYGFYSPYGWSYSQCNPYGYYGHPHSRFQDQGGKKPGGGYNSGGGSGGGSGSGGGTGSGPGTGSGGGSGSGGGTGSGGGIGRGGIVDSPARGGGSREHMPQNPRGDRP